MSNWEKMLDGQLYNDFSKDLFNRRVTAKQLFRKYNATDDSQQEVRRALLQKLLGRVGESVWIEPDFRCEYGTNIYIGSNTYINFDCIVLDCAKVEIGSNVLMGPRIGLYAANHAIHPEERAAGGCYGRPIVIKDKAWICGDVKIAGGVTIGEGAIIGMGSVVTKDVPPNVVAAGNPCKVIREITQADRKNFVPEID